MYGANPDSDSNRGGMPYKTASNKWSPDEPDWMDGIDVWGHARSRDLIHWEHLPISVFPDPKKDEFFIWWGCTRINGDGIPTIIYTSVGHERNPTDSAEQFIAYGDDELMRWKQADDLNPILSNTAAGSTMSGATPSCSSTRDATSSFWVGPIVYPSEAGRSCCFTKPLIPALPNGSSAGSFLSIPSRFAASSVPTLADSEINLSRIHI